MFSWLWGFKDEGNKVLQNSGILLQHYMALQPTRLCVQTVYIIQWVLWLAWESKYLFFYNLLNSSAFLCCIQKHKNDSPYASDGSILADQSQLQTFQNNEENLIVTSNTFGPHSDIKLME
jgi:hypothetical protein